MKVIENSPDVAEMISSVELLASNEGISSAAEKIGLPLATFRTNVRSFLENVKIRLQEYGHTLTLHALSKDVSDFQLVKENSDLMLDCCERMRVEFDTRSFSAWRTPFPGYEFKSVWRRTRRLSPIVWNSEMDSLLGTQLDIIIANQLELGEYDVKRRRLLLNIRAFDFDPSETNVPLFIKLPLVEEVDWAWLRILLLVHFKPKKVVFIGEYVDDIHIIQDFLVVDLLPYEHQLPNDAFVINPPLNKNQRSDDEKFIRKELFKYRLLTLNTDDAFKVPDEITSLKLNTAGLPNRVVKRLSNYDIHTLGELRALQWTDAILIPAFGMKAVNCLSDLLHFHGLSFRKEIPSPKEL